MTALQVLVTGGGSGIGRAVAQVLAEAGLQVLLLGRQASALQETLAGLPNQEHHRVCPADIRDPESIRAALRKVGVSSLYAVIANAGIGGENEYGDGDRWDDILATNLSGTYYTIHEALPYLQANREAQDVRHVVVIASILARLGVPGYEGYCASKAGLLGLVRAWASAWAPNRILANAICPGWVKTEMAMQGLRTFAEASGKSLDEIYAEQMAMVPLGKMSMPEEVGRLVGYLLSEGQTSFTGQTLDINNGALMP